MEHIHKKTHSPIVSFFLVPFLIIAWVSGCDTNSNNIITPDLQEASPTPIEQIQPSATAEPTVVSIEPTVLTMTPSLYPNGNSNPMKISLAWFYKPPVVSTDPLITYFDQFILTMEDESYRDQLKTNGVKGPFLQYLLLNEIIDPGSCNAQPFHNQVAFQIGDICRIQNNYKDWFLVGINDKPISSNQYVMMDAGNTEWRKFWLDRARVGQEKLGWDGVFLDNVEASLSKFDEIGTRPMKYPTDASYQTVIETFLKNLYTTYFQPQGRPLFANIIAINDPQVPLRYLQYLDGAMLEDFAVGWATEESLAPDTWEQQMQWVSQAQNMGKSVILVAQGQRNDLKREEFALASYLLVNDGHATFRYTHKDHYDEIWLYPNYKLDLGKPLGPRFPDGTVWKRDFTNGSVEVDPVDRTAVITIH